MNTDKLETLLDLSCLGNQNEDILSCERISLSDEDFTFDDEIAQKVLEDLLNSNAKKAEENDFSLPR